VSRIRWMPRWAALVTSSRVSPARLASSTPLRLDHSASRVEVGRVAGQWLHDQPGPLAPQPGTHRPATVGGQPVPQQGCLLPAEEASQLAQGADQGLRVVGADLMVEGEGRAATAGAVAQGGGHGCPLPLEPVADDWGVAARRPGTADNRQQRGARLVPEHKHGPTPTGVAADPKASPRPPNGRWPARHARPRGGRGAAGGSAGGGAAASTRGRDGSRPRSAARSSW
jgi:hypothetical protein